LKVHLICPGLFGLCPDPRALPQTPSLDRLLARADAHESPPRDPLETLAAQFGVCAPPGGDLPSAALCLLAEAPDQARAGCWFHADPVHLRADRDRLLLFSGPSLAVTDAEAAALVSAFNAHFEARVWSSWPAGRTAGTCGFRPSPGSALSRSTGSTAGPWMPPG